MLFNMFDSCLNKQKQVERLFADCRTREDIYQKIIELGRQLPPLNEVDKTENNRVQGCQSQTYLSVIFQDGVLTFAASSDALISAGLAALLILVYNNEPPEVLLKCPPEFLERLQIQTSLTPNRSNGLYSMHLKMKQEALAKLVQSL